MKSDERRSPDKVYNIICILSDGHKVVEITRALMYEKCLGLIALQEPRPLQVDRMRSVLAACPNHQAASYLLRYVLCLPWHLVESQQCSCEGCLLQSNVREKVMKKCSIFTLKTSAKVCAVTMRNFFIVCTSLSFRTLCHSLDSLWSLSVSELAIMGHCI